MKTATEARNEIEAKARESATQECRIIEMVAAEGGTVLRCAKTGRLGVAVRQGDVYVHLVSVDHPKGAESKSRQLAFGTTQGSRHVAEAPAMVYEGKQLPKWCDKATFLGPRIVSLKRFVITHPEHAHVSLPEGHYQITHQLDARTLQRVQD